MDLIKELGLQDKLLWSNTKTGIYINSQIYDFTSSLDLLKFNAIGIPDRIRTGAALYYLLKTTNYHKFEKITAHNWILKYMGKSSYKNIWKPLLIGKFGKDKYKTISMAWFWSRIHSRGSEKSTKNKTEQLGYIKGGYHSFVKQLEIALQNNGVNINTCSFIKEINKNRNDTWKVKIEINGKELIEDYEYVIFTIPNKLANNLLPEIEIPNILHYGAICMILKTNIQLTPYYWLNINDRSFPFLALIEHTNMVKPSNYNGNHILYISNYLPQEHKYFSLNNDELLNIYLPYLKKINNKFSRENIKEVIVSKSPFAQPIVDLNYKNQIIPFKTKYQEIYIMNMSQIYPQDRGINFAIEQSLKLSGYF